MTGGGHGGARDRELQRLRREAVEAARRDAPVDGGAGRGRDAPGRRRLRERAGELLDEVRGSEQRTLAARLTDLREEISDRLTRADLALDRLVRTTGEILRLRMRVAERRERVAGELKDGHEGGGGLTTRLYIGVLVFLGAVEFFANAPVFSNLMPRDPLAERQIRLVAETSEGWLAGAERVIAGLVLRPDAALLAAGVVTFLCVLAHFFGHSLQEWVVQRDREVRRETTTGRSASENVVPMVLTGLGLVLVLGVLYEARVTLGDVGQQRYTEDMAAVEEMRRNAGWLRADGDLLAANELSDRADDMATAAAQLRDYSDSLSRLSFPILLLNLTLVLSALSAAYFHRRPRHGERFNDELFEEERRRLTDDGEALVEQVALALSETGRDLRRLRSAAAGAAAEAETSGEAAVLEALEAYRRELARLTGRRPDQIPPLGLPAPTNGEGATPAAWTRAQAALDELEESRRRLRERFEEARSRFMKEAVA